MAVVSALLSVMLTAVLVSGRQCPLGFEAKNCSLNAGLVQNTSVECECAVSDSMVKCNQETQSIRLRIGDCLTYSDSLGTVLVSACPYIHPAAENSSSFYFPFQPNMTTSKVNGYMCGEMNRTGSLCGKCKNGTGPSVFSHDLKCVQCLDSRYGWVVYLAAEFIPITVFVLLIVLFRIRLCADHMNGLVFFCSLTSLVILDGYEISVSYLIKMVRKESILLLSLYNIFNLKFFQNYLPLFCISEKMTNVEVVALNYLVALYPLFLIVLIYALVSIHDTNFKVAVLIWRPFKALVSCFSESFDVRHSLIDAFVSFFILSYLKFATPSFTILLPAVCGVGLRKRSLNSTRVHYIDGTPYSLGGAFSVLAILALSIFVFLPTILLLVYPTKTFQKCLNCCGLRCLPLHIFMDAFQGCYKNGTEGTRDYRYFAGIYLILRFLVFLDLFHYLQLPSYATPSILLVVFAFSFALCRPYKRDIFNKADAILHCNIALLSFTILRQHKGEDKFSKVQEAVIITLLCTPLFYLIVFVGCCLFQKFNNPFGETVRRYSPKFLKHLQFGKPIVPLLNQAY